MVESQHRKVMAPAMVEGCARNSCVRNPQTVDSPPPGRSGPPRCTPPGETVSLYSRAGGADHHAGMSADFAVPLTHWTPAALAREAIAPGIVEQISPRQVGVFKKGGRFKAAFESLLAESHARTPSSSPSMCYRCPTFTETPPPWRTRGNPKFCLGCRTRRPHEHLAKSFLWTFNGKLLKV